MLGGVRTGLVAMHQSCQKELFKSGKESRWFDLKTLWRSVNQCARVKRVFPAVDSPNSNRMRIDVETPRRDMGLQLGLVNVSACSKKNINVNGESDGTCDEPSNLGVPHFQTKPFEPSLVVSTHPTHICGDYDQNGVKTC